MTSLQDRQKDYSKDGQVSVLGRARKNNTWLIYGKYSILTVGILFFNLT